MSDAGENSERALPKRVAPMAEPPTAVVPAPAAPATPAPAPAGAPPPAAGGAPPAVPTAASAPAKEVRWKKTRRTIAESYCRVVAVIDDDIERTSIPILEGEATASEGVSISPRFWRLRNDLQEKKILCHLHAYPKGDISADHPVAEKLLDIASSVASAANVVILDWHLGKTQGSDHAEAIIERLLETGGLRFVIINSNDEPGSVRSRLTEKQFTVPLTFSEPPAGTVSQTIRAKLGQRIFILIRKKADLAQADADAATLVDQVFGWMESSFPDHLHWAGLELSARVAEMLPSVLGSLPRTTDVPLFHQWLFNDETETNDQVVAFLLDELGIQFGLHPLTALDERCMKERITEKMQALVAPDFLGKPAATELWKNIPAFKADVQKVLNGSTDPELSVARLVASLVETWETSCIQAARSIPQSDLSGHFPGQKKWKSKEERIATYLRHAFDAPDAAFAAWAALYESSLGDLGSPKRFFTGFVLKSSGEDGDNPAWLLCVTPGCDCRWDKVEAFAFLPGALHEAGASSQDMVITCVNTGSDGTQTIAWNPRQIVLKERSRQGGLVDGYVLAGSIRPMHAVRIAQRTWSHQMRVAVDVPDYARSLRKEGDF